MSILRNLFIILIIVSCSFSAPIGKKIQRSPAEKLPDIIFYPGTFDPFHQTHFDEVTSILTHNPQSQVVILPIEEAYYFPPSQFARIFEYSKSQELIQKAFENNSNVIVSDGLRSINSDVFLTLENLGKKYPGKETAFLIGTDVLDLWKTIPGFEYLLSHISLIVSKDPKDTESFLRLSEIFANNPRIRFIDTHVQGIRSREIKLKLVQDVDDFSYLPEKVAQYFKDNPYELDQSMDNLMRRLSNLMDKEFDRAYMPLLEKSSLDRNVTNLIKNNRNIRKLFYQVRPNDPLSVSWLVRELQLNFTQTSQLKTNPYLFEQMFRFFNEGEVGTYLTSPIVRRNIEMFRVLTDRVKISSKHAYQGLFSRVINKLGHMVWSVGQQFFRQSGQLKKILFDIPIDQNLLGLSKGINTGDLEITVYRGVRPHENMASLLEIWQEEGFLSKVALNARKKGISVDEAITESSIYLKEKGLQKSLVDHIVGDWSQEAPFISTSFDKITAAKYAGKDGYVFTIKVKLSEGYFLNNLAYWQHTPWAKTGNPVEYLHEFVIPHQIKPEMIIARELITEEPPPTAVHASTITIGKILKAVPWKVMYGVKSCTNIFRKVNARKQDSLPLY